MSDLGATPELEPWDCPRCGHHNVERNCAFCRYVIDPAGPPPASVETSETTSGTATGPAPRRRPVARIVVTAIVVALLAAAALVLLGRRSGHSYPATWDPRVADVANFVAGARGLTFKHPVPVDFLSVAAYRKVTSTSEQGLSAKDRRKLQQALETLRAVGLVSGNVDLLKQFNTLNGEGTLAFYDDTHKRVRVKGTAVSPALRVTLAHELTHVLQDQHFGLSGIRKEGDSGAASAYRALAEGDADRIEQKYVDTLGQADKASYDAEQATESTRGKAQLASVPPALVSFFAAPYALGDQFVDTIDQARGGSGVDTAFRAPPHSEKPLLDPFVYPSGDKVVKVSRPKLTAGEKLVDKGDFGAVAWYLVLASRVDPHRALAAVDGWGGDAYVAFNRAGRTCVRIDTAGTDQGATTVLGGAMTEWAKTMPAGAARVTTGATIEVDSCDPGAKAASAGAGASTDLLTLPASRAAIAVDAIKAGATERAAQCFSHRVVNLLTIKQLESSDAELEASGLAVRIRDIAAGCRSAG